MSDSTSISDLPIGGPSINPGTHGPGNDSLDQSTINLLVNGLQQAKTTQLSSRDIPVTTDGLVNDAHVQPNYVPQPETEDYIGDYNVSNDYEDDNKLDDIYNELQTPILIAVLYFLFQLPIFRKSLFRYFPILFATDGNLNINGFLFNSILFGMIYYLVNKITKQG
jgi:hypothetical protein